MIEAIEPASLDATVMSPCPDLEGSYEFTGEALPGGRPKSRFNSPLTIANAAFVGGDAFIFENRVPFFRLIQTPALLAIEFRALDGSDKHFLMNGPADEIVCTQTEVVIKKRFETVGERVTGHNNIIHALSRDGSALVVRTDMRQTTQVFFCSNSKCARNVFCEILEGRGLMPRGVGKSKGQYLLILQRA